MASKLYFLLADLLPILAHAEAAPAQQVSFAQLCDKSLWKPGTVPQPGGYCTSEDIDQSKIAPQVFFVKDEGAYLMSAGNPRQLIPGQDTRSVVVYADGCDPDKNPDWWDEVTSRCGGDDFGFDVPTAMLRAAIARKPGATQLCISLGKRTMSFTAR